ncbi:hypothetical protein GCM10023228_03120 [Brevibacillus fulvus]
MRSIRSESCEWYADCQYSKRLQKPKERRGINDEKRVQVDKVDFFGRNGFIAGSMFVRRQ